MKMFEDNPTIEQTIMPFYEQAATEFQNWLTTDLVPNMSKIIGELSTGLLSVVTVVKNILIGVIVMVYFSQYQGYPVRPEQEDRLQSVKA